MNRAGGYSVGSIHVRIRPLRIANAVFKITLGLEAHPVWRRIAVPLNIPFDGLYRMIQAAFGGSDHHLHEFFIYEDVPPNSEYSSDDHINRHDWLGQKPGL